MTQEEKQLLLQDLCARLPYGVKIHLKTPEHGELIGTLDAVYPTDDRIIVDNLNKAIARINVRCGGFNIEENECKPYLRPMSSMTEEEIKELSKIDQKRIIFSARHLTWHLDGEIIDYLNEKMFDWRGLISKGLALKAPEGMYT